MIKRRTTVLIGADERTSSRDLPGLLEGHDFLVFGVAADGRQLLDAARRMMPDVVIVDESMPESTIDVLRALAAERLGSRVIVLAMDNDGDAAIAALRAGAVSFLLRDSIGQELIHAVHLVAQGHVYIAAAVTDEAMRQMGAIDDALELTGRQRQVLRLTLKGRSLHQIANELNLSTHAVETYKHEILRALGVQSTAGLVRYAVEQRPRLH